MIDSEMGWVQVLKMVLQSIKPFLIPICFVTAWLFVISLLATLTSGIQQTVKRAKQMHQVPCYNCQFFTNDYRLKCTVNPTIANTEKAIDCFDYREKNI